ncbi:MAG: hypothetical protein CR217_12995 [Beijerinckiaceae bacterium]|nr:MAG: hypothetical protein CR217_12995 [Beijerinckiaceae bacterium]
MRSTCHKASHFASFRHQKPRLLASTGDMASLNLVLAGPIRGPPWVCKSTFLKEISDGRSN